MTPLQKELKAMGINPKEFELILTDDLIKSEVPVDEFWEDDDEEE
jgi:hypothetical protein